MKFTDHHLTAPTLKARDAVTDLLNFSIVTWTVPPDALAAQLPPGFEPDTYILDDGSEVSFVSAVPFDDDRFHFRFAPFVKVSMSQINLRAYVLYEGERGLVLWHAPDWILELDPPQGLEPPVVSISNRYRGELGRGPKTEGRSEERAERR